MTINARSRIISIYLIEKIKLHPEYAKQIGIDYSIINLKNLNTPKEIDTKTNSVKDVAVELGQ